MHTFPIITSNVTINNELVSLTLRWGALMWTYPGEETYQGLIHLRRSTIRRGMEPNELFVGYKSEGFPQLTTIHFSNDVVCNLWVLAMSKCVGWKIENYYTLGERIGFGSFGTVFNAIRVKDSSEVALKSVDSRKMHDFNELEIMAKLQHPSLMNYLDCLRTDKKTFIVLPLMQSDLRKVVDDFGPMSEALARQCMRQILQGVEYMHSHRIAHRDLKLANVLCSQDSYGIVEVKIADFGGARYLEEGECFRGPRVPTTPISRAPEQVLGLPYRLEADIFACGGMIFELLTGLRAFGVGACTREEVFHAIAEGIMTPVPQGIQLSEMAISLIVQMLRPNPETRATASEALAHSWFQE